jgi:predicted kinase
MADCLSEGDNLNREIASGQPKRGDIGSPYRQEVIFTVGLPASGKTTWAREQCTNGDTVRVNRDDLRNMRGNYWIPDQEGMITDWEVRCALMALNSGKSVIIDATNLNEKRRHQFCASLTALTTIPFVVNIKKFDTSVEECIKRDKERTEGKVGKKVILGMANQYGLRTKYPEYRFQAGLPTAIICDLDGTLAHNITGRGFYDWLRVGEDEVDDMVNRILDVHRVNGDKILIMSGRDGICLPQTAEWLGENNIEHDMLVMRSAGDQRKDSIVKKELFDLHIKDKYNVLFALDDRDQVVDMWRKELGIKCLQVNYGDF